MPLPTICKYRRTRFLMPTIRTFCFDPAASLNPGKFCISYVVTRSIPLSTMDQFLRAPAPLRLSRTAKLLLLDRSEDSVWSHSALPYLDLRESVATEHLCLGEKPRLLDPI